MNSRASAVLVTSDNSSEPVSVGIGATIEPPIIGMIYRAQAEIPGRPIRIGTSVDVEVTRVESRRRR